ncbi:MAG: orotidine-5'-phosphate decarboxylase [Pseudomonadota bacterium]
MSPALPDHGDIVAGEARARVYCAIDTVDLEAATELTRTLIGAVDGIKLGLEFFLANGSSGYARIADLGLPIFLDLKFHDIPNTVAGAMRAVKPLAPRILTIHAGGGEAMMRRAVEAADDFHPRPFVVGVTVLTSLDADDLKALGVDGDPRRQAERLAGLAIGSGLDGIVCSPHELGALRRAYGDDFVAVVPGLRPSAETVARSGEITGDDQKRIMTPRAAQSAGASVLVIGRPITQAEDPRAAALAIRASLADPN